MSVVEPGHCDPLDIGCWDNYLLCNTDQCTFGNCEIDIGISTTPMRIPADVPVKTTLKGLMPAPFAKIRFESMWTPDSVDPYTGPATPATEADWDFTEITTGNVSQPFNSDKCRSAIKSFQYSWGTISSGFTCKVVIVDEVGSDLEAWFQRIFKNPAIDSIVHPQGAFKMKAFIGWMIAGEDGNCPADFQIQQVGYPEVTGAYDAYTDISSIPINNSSTPTRFISSPPLWFIPMSLTASYQGNKITFEIEGKDALSVADQFPHPFTYGTDFHKVYFKEAVACLAADSQPPFNVRFKQLNTAGQVEDLKFHVISGAASGTANDCTPGFVEFDAAGRAHTCPHCIDLSGRQSAGSESDRNRLEELGPIGVWPRHNLSPLQTIKQWLRSGNVRAKSQSNETGQQGKGMTVNFDSINRTCTLWGDGGPGCGRTVELNTTENRIKACYIVSGGKCSPVYSFTPAIKWNFLAAVQRGGTLSPATVAARSASDADRQQALPDGSPICSLPGVGTRTSPVTAENSLNTSGSSAARELQLTNALHRRANQLFTTVEAELRVQGDPSDWLCSPLFGYGRFVAIIVNNPYYLEEDTQFGCPLWKQGDQITHNSCHNVLTSPAWFLKGVDHQVRDGTYITTLKVALFPPNAELSGSSPDNTSVAQGMGGVTQDGILYVGPNTCNQGTNPCTGAFQQRMQMGELSGGFGINPQFVARGPGGDGTVDIGPGTNVFCNGACQTNPGIA